MSENPNYKNFGGIVNEVLNFGFNDGPQVNRKRVEGWVNEAQFQIAREVEAPEFQETEELELTQGTWQYALPTEFLRVQDVYYPEGTWRLKPVELQQFDTSSPRVFEGPPEIYTLYKSELWLFPCPNKSQETLEVRYIKDPPQLTNETDVPILAGNYWHLLIDYATARAFEAEDDQEMAQAKIGRYKQDLAAYANDVQWRVVDRPRVLDGTWGGGYYGGAIT